MAKGSFNIGDEVAITAKVHRRVTEDRVSVSIPSYGQPHSILDRTSKVKQGQEIELIGDVTYVDEEAGKVTVNLGIPVTVKADTLRLVTRYMPPKRKTPLVDKAT
jgi:2-phosphoglycerate kinase